MGLVEIDGKPVQRYIVWRGSNDLVFIEHQKHLSWEMWENEVDLERRSKYCTWLDIERATQQALAHDNCAHLYTRNGEVLSVVSPLDYAMTRKVLEVYFKREAKKWVID